MATQRVSIAVVAGAASDAVAAAWTRWQRNPAPDAVDRFCEALHANAAFPPVVYCCEWIDRWLMGHQLLGAGAVSGRRFEAVCLTRDEALARADCCGTQWMEQHWLASRLREAADAWGGIANPRVVVVAREVLGESTRDEEVAAPLREVPAWLAAE